MRDQNSRDDEKSSGATKAENPIYPDLVAMEATYVSVSKDGRMDDDLYEILLAEEGQQTPRSE